MEVIKLHIQKEVLHIQTCNDLKTVATKAWNSLHSSYIRQ